MPKKIALALSGGQDSAVLLYLAAEQADELYVLTYNYNQRHKRELACAFRQVRNIKEKYPDKKVEHRVIDTSFLRDISPTSSLTNDKIPTPDVHSVRGEAQPASYVPNRNMMFLSILAAYAESNEVREIWYGATGVDSLAGYWDGDIPFIERINHLLSLNRENQITVMAPLIEMDKKDIVLEGVRLGVVFGDTWTCYAGEELADANSASSSLRLQGFIDAGYRDSVQYKQQDKLNELYKQHECKECK